VPLRASGRQPHHDDIGGAAGEYLPRVGDAVHLVAGGGDGIVEVQLADIIAGGADGFESEAEVAQGLVTWRLAVGGEELFADQFLALAVLALEKELAGLGQRGGGALERFGHRRSAPDRVLVELQMLLPYAAEDHCTEAPVPDRQSCLPVRRRKVVPERERSGRLARGGVGAGRRRQCDDGRRKGKQNSDQSPFCN
jgi:hypothetical protein